MKSGNKKKKETTERDKGIVVYVFTNGFISGGELTHILGLSELNTEQGFVL